MRTTGVAHSQVLELVEPALQVVLGRLSAPAEWSQHRAGESRCRCGGGEPSPGVDVAAVRAGWMARAMGHCVPQGQADGRAGGRKEGRTTRLDLLLGGRAERLVQVRRALQVVLLAHLLDQLLHL